MVHERIDSLSGREREVLAGLARGDANRAIAFDLGISARTFEVYRAKVMHKMGAKTLSDLVRMVTTARVFRSLFPEACDREIVRPANRTSPKAGATVT